MRDVDAGTYESREKLISDIKVILNNSGYASVDFPLMEPTELFVRKSGGDISGRLYSFTDPGGNKVSLRPEFTSSVIRSYIDQNIDANSVIRLQYSGPVFRYSGQGLRDGLRQFTQQGCEVIGSSGLKTDAEVLALAIASVAASGIEKITVKLGNLGMIRSILEGEGISEALLAFTLANLHSITSPEGSIDAVVENATKLGLVTDGSRNKDNKTNYGEESIDLIQYLMSDTLSGNTGIRTKEEIVTRLISKYSDEITSSDYRDSLGALNDFFSTMVGNVSDIEINSNSPTYVSEAYSYVNNLIDSVESPNLDVQYKVDFGSSRGLTYYSGLIFDIEYWDKNEAVPIGGGGRYDGLVRSLGGQIDVPAIGFAINIDTLLDVVSEDQPG